MGGLQVGLKPEREESRSVQTTRTVFVLTNLVVSLLWIRFLIRLIEQWSSMKPDIRYAAGIFMVFFGLLWVTLIRDKKGYLSIAMACGILATAYRIIWVLM